MSTYTTNYNLEKPDSTDDFGDFRTNYNNNMDIIDQNLGGGGGGGNVDDVLVNGVSVVDGNHDAQITSYKEVTQAEYDALPATKLTDGIAYFIKDVDNASVEGYPPLIYSLTEREVGVWEDGKPLYQRTIEQSSTNVSGTEVQVDLSSWNIDECVEVSGFFNRVASGNKSTYYFNSREFYSSSEYWGFVKYHNVNKYLAFSIKLTSSTTSKQVFTLLYTKTTDVAGSGIWNGQGGLAHHYSTSEKIIGTWIDNKPLYEITYSITTPSTENQVTIIQDITSLNIGSIADIKGMIDNIPINWAQGDANLSACWINGTKTGIAMKVGNSSLTNKSCNVTVQYTKTTD